MVDNEVRRRPASIPVAFAFVALAVAGCGGTRPPESSADSTVAGTVQVCSSCHGPDGRSISPTFPRLAGQQKDYIVAQLQAFRDKTRADPHAQTYMWGMAARLSDPTIDAIAAYYASQTPVAGQASDSPETVAGKKIFTEGIPS
jgi:cytochrome c553